MRLRFRYSRLGKVRWTSHRDMARMWERAFRRVELPLAYSQGFSPRPKVSFGLALSTGHESVAEYLDVELAPEATVDVSILSGRLSPALPVGIDVLTGAVIDDRAESLQHEVTSCSWEIEAAGLPFESAADAVERALAASELIVTRQRKGKSVTDDIRPAVISLNLLGPSPAGTFLECELATAARGVRPSELLLALGDGIEEGRVRRTNQWIERDGARWEPLPLDATSAPHAEVRAS